mmetsp:Transcript_30437/g.94186  ORF Transcript_30437/g.94186 Transcript_30437/m.94186 type:complete len:232 (-) Transcript_30437:52-747(-)
MCRTIFLSQPLNHFFPERDGLSHFVWSRARVEQVKANQLPTIIVRKGFSVWTKLSPAEGIQFAQPSLCLLEKVIIDKRGRQFAGRSYHKRNHSVNVRTVLDSLPVFPPQLQCLCVIPQTRVDLRKFQLNCPFSSHTAPCPITGQNSFVDTQGIVELLAITQRVAENHHCDFGKSHSSPRPPIERLMLAGVHLPARPPESKPHGAVELMTTIEAPLPLRNPVTRAPFLKLLH